MNDADAATMLENRVRKNAAHRQKWARRHGITCYRIYERDIPEIPLVVDWYEGRLHVAERARPNIDALSPEAHAAWLAAMVQALVRALGVEEGGVHVKRRERQKGTAQYTPFARTGERFIVREGPASFWVNLRDYLDTGLFLDHRPLRLRVGGEAQDKRLLNLFCYTGAFSVHAGLGGASQTTSVDLSQTYVDWARDNFALNDLDPRRHRLVRADVTRWLEDPVVQAERYDLIVLDPPTFSNSARMEGVFDVQRDHAPMLAVLGRMLAPGGVIFFSTNCQRFRLDAERLGPLVAEDISEKSIPEDFRDRSIHRAWRMTRPA
jgi:23S rRNA G2069 N7-methylase RlmK/C1962 C5-methylase RlmI